MITDWHTVPSAYMDGRSGPYGEGNWRSGGGPCCWRGGGGAEEEGEGEEEL